MKPSLTTDAVTSFAVKLALAIAAAFTLAGLGIHTDAKASDISSFGATFPFLFAKWADAYKKETGNGRIYLPLGSGGKTAIFRATDAPLKPDRLAANGLVQWPQVIGAIVLAVNLGDIGPGELVLDGPTLAKIYLGEIKTWNDAAIQKLNPNVDLPSAAITVVHRSDASGTTFNFTDYLSKVSPDWSSKVGENTSVEWPVGLGGKGNQAVADYVMETKGAIGYVEYAYAKQDRLTVAKLVNKDGKIVSATMASFEAAAANADWAHAPGFYQILTDQPGAASWPLTAATFVVMPKQPQDPVAATEALKFFSWAFANGAEAAEDLDYIPIPAAVVTLIEQEWAEQIKGPDGKALLN
ncbi:MAG: phosphate ABC transporter substrate-binding protein PstS [Beijerinckiaceae bacterium]